MKKAKQKTWDEMARAQSNKSAKTPATGLEGATMRERFAHYCELNSNGRLVRNTPANRSNPAYLPI